MKINMHGSIPGVTGFASELEAVKAANEALEGAKRDSVKAVERYLIDNPGTMLTCGKIAKMFGVRPCDVVNLMDKYLGSCSEVYHTSAEVTRKYIEVDDNGAIIPGERIKIVNHKYSCYRAFGR